MLGGADALGYSVRVADRARPRRHAGAPVALVVYSLFWVGLAAYSLYLSFFDWDMASPQKTIAKS